MNRIFFAVMLCTINLPKKVNSLGIRIRDMLYANTALFTTPPIMLIAFKAQLDKAIAAQAKVDKGSVQDTADRDTQVLLLFQMLNPVLINYVNTLYKGNRTNILASGFSASNEPNPKEVPSIPVIRKMLMTDLADHIAKIYLAPFPKPVNGSRGVVNYILQVAVGAATEENFKTVLQTTNSRKLLVENLTRGQEVHIRICAWNTRGMSAWSSILDFMPS
jgi:hypothetical protein